MLFYGRDWARCQTIVVVCDRNKVVAPSLMVLPHWKLKRNPLRFGSLRMRCMSVWLSSSPRFVVSFVVVVVVVVSHIQRIGCQPEKNYFTRWPIPLVVCRTGSIHVQICARVVHWDCCFEAFVDDTRSRRRPTEQCSEKASVCTAQDVALRIAAVRKGPTWSHVPWTAGRVFFLFLLCTYVFYNLHQTEMKHNNQNML